MTDISFKNVDVEIATNRWDIRITIIEKDGKKSTWIASADSYYTEGDSIWFGSKKEYEDFEG